MRKKIYLSFILMVSVTFVLLLTWGSKSPQTKLCLVLCGFVFLVNYFLHVRHISWRSTGVAGALWTIPVAVVVPFVLWGSVLKGMWKFRHVYY